MRHPKEASTVATKVDELTRNEADRKRNTAHYARLLEVLGDGREWEYTGICNDLEKPVGKCACGHPVRYEFVIERMSDKKTAVLGSECINYFKEVNPETFAAMQAAHAAILAKLAEAKKAAKAAQQAVEVEAARHTWQGCKERAEAILEAASDDNRFLPYDLYRLRYRTAYLDEAPEYQRACDLRKWYEKAAKEIGRVLGNLSPVHTWERRRGYRSSWGWRE